MIGWDKKPFSYTLVRSYMMLNRVAGCNPMQADSRVEKFANNVLFNLNLLTLSLITGIVTASVKTSMDDYINSNQPVIFFFVCLSSDVSI